MMQKFNQAYDKVIGRFEKGYSNDPDDRGGETYDGISRVNHPNWEGWKIIDAAKALSNFPKNLANNNGLEQLVRDFYKRIYWDCFRSDDLPYEIAEELFDISVNLGTPRATEILQRSINLLNKNQKSYQDIPVDRNFGQMTFKALKECINRNSYIMLYNVLNIFQGKHYIEIMEKNSVQEKYLGWFSRIDIAKF